MLTKVLGVVSAEVSEILSSKNFKFDETNIDQSRVFKSTLAGIRASEHRKEKKGGTSPEITRGGLREVSPGSQSSLPSWFEKTHPEVQGRQIWLRFEGKTKFMDTWEEKEEVWEIEVRKKMGKGVEVYMMSEGRRVCRRTRWLRSA